MAGSFAAMALDLSVYLVTGRELLPPGKDYFASLEESIRNGHVSIVQIREKKASFQEFLDIARASLTICDKYHVRMIINDNIDVAERLPERVGLHIGQDDEKIECARKRLGPNRIIGLSVHSVEEAHAALNSDVNYVGIGPCWPTKSKDGVKDEDALLLRGARDVVASLRRDPASTPPGKHASLPCVLIGGINARTARRSLLGSSTDHSFADGIAVISAIVSRQDPDVAAEELHDIITSARREYASFPSSKLRAYELVKQAQDVLTAYHARYDCNTCKYDTSRVTLPRPLVQSITSHVSANFSANITLAFSASPIMSQEAREAEALSYAKGSLLLNIGSLSPEARHGMSVAGPAANERGKPIVLDPVGAGATSFRLATVHSILNETQVTLIKGNAAELAALCGSNDAKAQGVDSVGELQSAPALVRRLARQEGAFVLLTGEVDYLTDGECVIESRCGSEMLGSITATGCSLGCMVAAGLAAAQAKYGVRLGCQTQQRIVPPRTHSALLVGALAALLTFTIASERAAELPTVHGPGSFIPALVDEVASFDPTCLPSYVERVTLSAVS